MFREKRSGRATPMQSRAQLDHLARVLEGIPVWGSMPGTPGHDAGIAYGDILLSVNGVKTSSVEDFVSARRLRSDGASIVLFRNGVELNFELKFRAG
jgi:S1-C subfamily serine protease